MNMLMNRTFSPAPQCKFPKTSLLDHVIRGTLSHSPDHLPTINPCHDALEVMFRGNMW